MPYREHRPSQRATMSSSSDVAHPKAVTVLFASVASPGQLNPLFAIAEALHTLYPAWTIAFATSYEARSAIEEAGFTYVPAWTASLLPKHLIACFNKAGIRNVKVMKEYTMWIRSQAMYERPKEALCHWIKSHRPALVVSDVISEAGMAAASETDTPYIINSPTPPYVSFPDHLPRVFPPLGSGVSVHKTSLWHRVYDLVTVAYYGLGLIQQVVPLVHEQEQKGLPSPSALAEKAMLVLNNTTPLLADARVRWPKDKLQWTGACLQGSDAALVDQAHFEALWKAGKHDDESRDLYSWLDEESKPVIVVALGTIYQLDDERISAIYQALSWLHVKVVWKLGKQHTVPTEARNNPNFYFIPWLPSLPLVLSHPHVKLFINHGGANSLHEGLYYGKPQVCIPAWMDCFDFAMRCQDAGAGLTINTAPHLDQDKLFDAVHEVLFGEKSTTFAGNAERIAADLVQLGGARQAAVSIAETIEHGPYDKNKSLKERGC